MIDALTESEIVTVDILNQRFNVLEERMMKNIYRAMIIQTGVIAAIVLGIVQLG